MATLITLVDNTVPVAADFNTNFTNLNNETRPVNRGGTGIAAYATGAMLYASGSTTLASLAVGSTRSVLTADGTTPAWSSGPTLSALTVNGTQAISTGVDGAVVNISGTLDRATTGTHTVMAGLYVTPPVVNSSGSTILSAASLFIPSAPTATGANNYGIWVDGIARFDSTMEPATMSQAGLTTPAANALYAESAVKAWGRITNGGAALSSFNHSTATTTAAGIFTVEYDRPFATATSYSVTADVIVSTTAPTSCTFDTITATGFTLKTYVNTTATSLAFMYTAIGNQ